MRQARMRTDCKHTAPWALAAPPRAKGWLTATVANKMKRGPFEGQPHICRMLGAATPVRGEPWSAPSCTSGGAPPWARTALCSDLCSSAPGVHAAARTTLLRAPAMAAGAAHRCCGNAGPYRDDFVARYGCACAVDASFRVAYHAAFVAEFGDGAAVIGRVDQLGLARVGEAAPPAGDGPVALAMEEDYRMVDGSPFWALVRAHPIPPADGGALLVEPCSSAQVVAQEAHEAQRMQTVQEADTLATKEAGSHDPRAAILFQDDEDDDASFVDAVESSLRQSTQTGPSEQEASGGEPLVGRPGRYEESRRLYGEMEDLHVLSLCTLNTTESLTDDDESFDESNGEDEWYGGPSSQGEQHGGRCYRQWMPFTWENVRGVLKSLTVARLGDVSQACGISSPSGAKARKVDHLMEHFMGLAAASPPLPLMPPLDVKGAAPFSIHETFNDCIEAVNQVLSSRHAHPRLAPPHLPRMPYRAVAQHLIERSAPYDFDFALPFPMILDCKVTVPIITKMIDPYHSRESIMVSFTVRAEDIGNAFYLVTLKLEDGPSPLQREEGLRKAAVAHSDGCPAIFDGRSRAEPFVLRRRSLGGSRDLVRCVDMASLRVALNGVEFVSSPVQTLCHETGRREPFPQLPPDLLVVGKNTIAFERLRSFQNNWCYVQIVQAHHDSRRWRELYVKAQCRPQSEMIAWYRETFGRRRRPLAVTSGKGDGGRGDLLEGESDDDDGIETSAIAVSLRCPISLQRMVRPMRSALCTHPQAMEMSSWPPNRTDQASGRVYEDETVCLICFKVCPISTLYIDGYLQAILDETWDGAGAGHCNERGADDVIIDAKSGLWLLRERGARSAGGAGQRRLHEGGSGDEEVPGGSASGKRAHASRAVHVLDLTGDDDISSGASGEGDRGENGTFIPQTAIKADPGCMHGMPGQGSAPFDNASAESIRLATRQHANPGDSLYTPIVLD